MFTIVVKDSKGTRLPRRIGMEEGAVLNGSDRNGVHL